MDDNMKIIENTKLINRNKKIAKYSSYATFAFIALSFYFSRKNDTASMIYTLIALLLCMVVWQISMYFTSRWGAKVCPHEMITSALKGLDDKYTLYHYSTPVSHLLASSNGLWIILPELAGGKISYSNGKWKQKGANTFLKIFGQDSLGRPDAESQLEVNDLHKALDKKGIQIDPGMIKPLALFFNKKAELSVNEAPIACVQSDKAKEYLRKQPKSPALTAEQLDSLKMILKVKES
jgi:hypothetical protein